VTSERAGELKGTRWNEARCATGSANVDRTYYLIGHASAGPHPYPREWYADFQCVIRRRDPGVQMAGGPRAG